MEINRKDITYIIEESTKRILNEISWNTSYNAVEKSENRKEILDDAWFHFYEGAQEMIMALNGISTKEYYKDDIQNPNTQGPQIATKIRELLDIVWKYKTEKEKQFSRLSSHENNKFNSAFGGRSKEEVSKDIENAWDEHFNADDYKSWDEYRKEHLTPDEIDFNDRF